MANVKRKSRGIKLFLLVAALAFAVRIDLAARVHTCFNGDESIGGVMAYHIQDRGARPLVGYAETHGAGSGVIAYMTAAMNEAFGRSTFNLRASAVLFFAIFAGLAVLLSSRAMGPVTAAFLGLHLVFSPQFFRLSLLSYGYFVPLTLMLLCCVILFYYMMGVPGKPAMEQQPPPWWMGALAGFIAGVAFWTTEFTAVMTGLIFVTYAIRWGKRAVPGLAGWTAAFPVGAAPLLVFNLRNDFVSFRHLIGGHGPGPFYDRPLMHFFTRELPSYFQNDNADYFTKSVPWTAWLLFGVTALCCILALYCAMRRPRGRRDLSGILVFGLVYTAAYAAVYNLSPFRGESARYFLPLEPFLIMGLAAGITELARVRRFWSTALAVAMAAVVIAADINGTAFAYRDDVVDDSYDNRISCGEVDRLVSFLEDRGTTRVFTNRFVKWMIVYKSEERIKAADANLVPRAVAWTEYEDAVTAAPNPAFLFNERDTHVPWLKAYLRAKRIPYGYADIGRYALIEPAAKISQIEFMEWCRASYENRARAN